MKTIVLLLTLTLTTMLQAQTNLTANYSNLTSDAQYGNCNQQIEDCIIYGDLNLNGHNLRLKGVNLTVTGNVILNNGNIITNCGNTSSYINGVEITKDFSYTLDNQEFINIGNLPRNLEYTVYDYSGRIIQKGNTNSPDFPRNKLIIISIENCKPLKTIIK